MVSDIKGGTERRVGLPRENNQGRARRVGRLHPSRGPEPVNCSREKKVVGIRTTRMVQNGKIHRKRNEDLNVVNGSKKGT